MQFSSLYFYALFNFEKTRLEQSSKIPGRKAIQLRSGKFLWIIEGPIEQIVGKFQKTKWSEKIADAHL